MATVWIFTHFIFLAFAVCTQAFNLNQIKVPKSDRIAGIFMIPESGQYLFNSTDAKTACQYLNVTIATTAQMEKALQLGLETCKFGWIDGEILVIPRIRADLKCGNGKTGLVTWNVNKDRKFCAYCFSSTADLQSTPKPNRSIPGTSKSLPTLTTLTQAPTTSPLRSKPKAPATSTTKGPELAPRTSALTPLVKSTRSSRFSSTSPPIKSISSTSSRSLPHLSTSLSSAARFTSAQASTTTSPSESVHVQPVNPARPPLGAVPMALIVLGIIVLLLTAAGIMWYYKLSVFPSCSRGQQKDDIETEMWKHTDSEVDLHQHEADEETDRKYSSDITLCANPDIKAHSSE